VRLINTGYSRTCQLGNNRSIETQTNSDLMYNIRVMSLYGDTSLEDTGEWFDSIVLLIIIYQLSRIIQK